MKIKRQLIKIKKSARWSEYSEQQKDALNTIYNMTEKEAAKCVRKTFRSMGLTKKKLATMRKEAQREQNERDKIEVRWHFIKKEGYPPDCLYNVWAATKSGSVSSCERHYSQYGSPWENLLEDCVAWHPIVKPVFIKSKYEKT